MIRSLVPASLVVLVAACGAKPAPPTVGSRGGGGAVARGPVMVFVGLGEGSMFEAACHDCDGLRAGMQGQLVSSGAATFRVTGPVSDDCGASGPTDVVGVARLSGDPEQAPLAVAVLPAGAPIDLEPYVLLPEAPPPVSDELRAALVRRANADLAGAATIAADDLVIEQVVATNVAGDPRPDQLISVNVPLPESEGPGYRWSALVMAPDGNPAAAVTLWRSELEHLTIDASFDLEGDGVRELIYSSEYYEGGARGAAKVTDGALAMLGTWGCGA